MSDHLGLASSGRRWAHLLGLRGTLERRRVGMAELLAFALHAYSFRVVQDSATLFRAWLEHPDSCITCLHSYSLSLLAG